MYKVKKHERLLKERVDEALGQVRVLQGLLPICSYCKKIRDDTGYWNQLEGYIRHHSEAEFTHSLCPECLREHFPGLDDEAGGAS
jgi:hypothetical protein